MRYAVALITLTFAAIASCQNLTFESISELARKVDKREITSEQLWDALGSGPGPFDCRQGCDVDRQYLGKFESDAGYDELVKLSQQDYARFLLLHSLDERSTLVAYVDAGESRYDPAEAKAILSGGKNWLQLRTYPRGGTGVSVSPTDWYELSQNQLRRVLRVPATGHQANNDPARSFETRFIRAETVAGIETLKFVYSVEFVSGYGSGGASIDTSLWQDERIVTFSRSKGEVAFHFDPVRSQMAKEYADRIFSYDDFYGDEFGYYRLLSDRLLEIARNPHDRRREWLKQLLEREHDIPMLEPVRKVFANAR
jgi:hypothetical protein